MFRGPVRPLRIGRARLQVEVADSILTRAVGLMFRRSLGRDAGVLLCFPRSGDHALHMWWVRMPLDIVFMDQRGRVKRMMRAIPGQGPFASGRRIRYALEVRAGFCRRYGIRVGARCRLPVSARSRA